MYVVLRVIIKWQYVNGNQIAGNSKANKRINIQTRQAIDSIRLQHQKCSENLSCFFFVQAMSIFCVLFLLDDQREAQSIEKSYH